MDGSVVRGKKKCSFHEVLSRDFPCSSWTIFQRKRLEMIFCLLQEQKEHRT